MKPPLAERIPKRLVLHGDERVDPYHWLNQREAPQVREHLSRENEYTEAVMRHARGLRERLFREM